MGLLVAGDGSPGYKTVERKFFTATAGQTVFTITNGYGVGDIDVYINGLRLIDGDDYTALNGTTVTLSVAAAAGDSIAVVTYTQFYSSGNYTKAESDSKYLGVAGGTVNGYIRTPNYGISSYSDSAFASLEANVGLGTQGVGIKAWGRSMATSGGDIHYIADTRGAGGGHRFYGWNGTSLTQFMSIKSNGVVTNPTQPAMFFTGTQNTYAARTTGFVPFNYLMGGVSDGGLGTGIWTCQNAGTYLIAQYTLIATATAYESRIVKNGVSVSRGYTSSGRSTNSLVVLNMNVGDYIQWYSDQDVYLHSTDQYSGLSIVKVG